MAFACWAAKFAAMPRAPLKAASRESKTGSDPAGFKA
jgi:hypothetical protein